MMFRLLSSACLGLALAAVCAGASLAQTAKKPDPAAKLSPEKPTAVGERKADQKPDAVVLSDVQKQFCLSNAAAAGDERLAWEAGKIAELENTLKQRVAELEAKRAEYMEWLKKRDEAMKLAHDDIVAIYAKMRPDAASSQLSAMDDPMAAAILAKLNARVASAILAEMEPGRAAKLTSAMAGPPTGNEKKRS